MTNTYTYMPEFEAPDGNIWLPDLEVELEATCDHRPGYEFSVCVTAVWIETYDKKSGDTAWINMLRQRWDNHTMHEMGIRIANKAEYDPAFIEQVQQAEGVHWTGRGGNDPEGRMVKEAV